MKTEMLLLNNIKKGDNLIFDIITEEELFILILNDERVEIRMNGYVEERNYYSHIEYEFKKDYADLKICVETELIHHIANEKIVR